MPSHWSFLKFLWVDKPFFVFHVFVCRCRVFIGFCSNGFHETPCELSDEFLHEIRCDYHVCSTAIILQVWLDRTTARTTTRMIWPTHHSFDVCDGCTVHANIYISLSMNQCSVHKSLWTRTTPKTRCVGISLRIRCTIVVKCQNSVLHKRSALWTAWFHILRTTNPHFLGCRQKLNRILLHRRWQHRQHVGNVLMRFRCTQLWRQHDFLHHYIENLFTHTHVAHLPLLFVEASTSSAVVKYAPRNVGHYIIIIIHGRSRPLL